MPDFVHLHCHTEYSLLDGSIRIGDLVNRAKEFGSPAAAITDHGNLHGAVTFYMAARAKELKPILGCEVNVAKESRFKEDALSRDADYHLVLLAQNLTGFKNLLKLVSMGHREGFHYKARVDKDILAKHSEGLIALSACIKGEIHQKLLKENMAAAIAMAETYKKIFPGRLYLEMQANDLDEQARLNSLIMELADEVKLPLVATNDCHYLTAEDAEAHDVLLCIHTAACVNDDRRMRFGTKELYYKTPEEMAEAFSHVPEAISNTCEISSRIDLKLDLWHYHFPVFAVPAEQSLDDVMCAMAREGLKKRLGKLREVNANDPAFGEKRYWERLEYELGVIKAIGFPGYFLIVQDFINWAKDHGIPVGPGRGSVAGSIVAYALKITNLDPLFHGLLFERFLNIERISMPDIDVDFCERRRVEVIRYITKKYGRDFVAQIASFGTLKAKAVVREVGRSLGMSFDETDRIAKLITEEMKMTHDKTLEGELNLRTLAALDPKVAKLIDVSKRLEGLVYNTSSHASGMVISDKPMTEYVPLFKGTDNEIVTQWDIKSVENSGLLVFDLFGLKALTLIQDALDNIRGMGGTPPDLDTLPFTDQATFDLFRQGDTDGIFQMESQGMRNYLRRLKPNCFEDLIAILALNQSGPLGVGMVEQFIQRVHGEFPVEYPHPSLEEPLKSTYGIIVYQEQIMTIAQMLGNFSPVESDRLCLAMGKNNPWELAELRTLFLSGARANDVREKKAIEIFDLMKKFSEYACNKSHFAAYVQISYYTAYLKAHYPMAFMAARIPPT